MYFWMPTSYFDWFLQLWYAIIPCHTLNMDTVQFMSCLFVGGRHPWHGHSLLLSIASSSSGSMSGLSLQCQSANKTDLNSSFWLKVEVIWRCQKVIKLCWDMWKVSSGAVRREVRWWQAILCHPMPSYAILCHPMPSYLWPKSSL